MLSFSGIRRNDFTWAKKVLGSNSLPGLKVCIVGGTNGLGQGIARELAANGAHVTVVGRTFRDQDVKNIDFISADLSTMSAAKNVAKQLPVESLDMVIFTAGILPGNKRLETSEGVEMDMAVSYLNRFVMLKEIVPRLTKTPQFFSKPRVFIMGMPGTNQEANLDDFNSAKTYGWSSHATTVVANEALVLHSASIHPDVDFFGLNPGLIQTSIRSNMLGTGILFNLIEGLMGFFNPTVEQYAKNLSPLLVSPDLTNKSSLLFNQSTDPIHPSKNMTPDVVARIIKESDILATSALQSSSQK